MVKVSQFSQFPMSNASDGWWVWWIVIFPFYLLVLPFNFLRLENLENIVTAALDFFHSLQTAQKENPFETLIQILRLLLFFLHIWSDFTKPSISGQGSSSSREAAPSFDSTNWSLHEIQIALKTDDAQNRPQSENSDLVDESANASQWKF